MNICPLNSNKETVAVVPESVATAPVSGAVRVAKGGFKASQTGKLVAF